MRCAVAKPMLVHVFTPEQATSALRFGALYAWAVCLSYPTKARAGDERAMHASGSWARSGLRGTVGVLSREAGALACPAERTACCSSIVAVRLEEACAAGAEGGDGLVGGK